MIGQSREHLRSAGESYWQHFRFATTFGLLALAAGVAAIIHAFVPALCSSTASRTVKLLGQLADDRHRLDEIEAHALEMKAFGLLILLATAVSLPLWLTHAPAALRLGYTLLAYALPFALLLTNGELETPVEEASELA